MTKILTNYGSSDPASLFENFHSNGESELVAIRDIIEANVKAPRTWGIKDAANMIGRSVSWLRKSDKNVPKNKSGQGRWSLERINAIRDRVGTRYKRPESSQPFVMSVINFKGGVAKTTSAIHLAQKGAIEGLRTLLIDLDSQASSTYNLGNILPELDLTEDDVINVAFLEDANRIRSLIKKTHFENVSILPANLALQELELVLPNKDLNNQDEMGPPAARLKIALDSIKNDYDLIVIDCPPSMGSISVNALVASDSILMPVPPASFDRASYVMFTSSIGKFYRQLKKPLRYVRILPTLHGGGKADHFHESRIRTLYSHVLTHNFFESAEVDKAATEMMSVYDLERPMNDRATYERALEIVNNVFGEIIDDLKYVWENE